MNIVEAAHQYHAARHVADASRENLINTMRRNHASGMTIVELARISGFSRPTVMKYVQNTTVSTVES